MAWKCGAGVLNDLLEVTYQHLAWVPAHLRGVLSLVALLLLKWLHFLSTAGWSLSNLASVLRLNLFTCPRSPRLAGWTHRLEFDPPNAQTMTHLESSAFRLKCLQAIG